MVDQLMLCVAGWCSTVEVVVLMQMMMDDQLVLCVAGWCFCGGDGVVDANDDGWPASVLCCRLMFSRWRRCRWGGCLAWWWVTLKPRLGKGGTWQTSQWLSLTNPAVNRPTSPVTGQRPPSCPDFFLSLKCFGPFDLVCTGVTVLVDWRKKTTKLLLFWLGCLCCWLCCFQNCGPAFWLVVWWLFSSGVKEFRMCDLSWVDPMWMREC